MSTDEKTLSEKYPCDKFEIIPEYSKDQFIRSAWIKLAKEDAPIEVFEQDFDAPFENEHQALFDSMSVEVDYQASVGYDREEPYIDYETYWEKEPYIATESYYDSDTKTRRTREVTKYKDVKKQRQVTKYKTVTDWSPFSGNHSTKSVVLVANTDSEHFDLAEFEESYIKTKDSSITVPSSEVAERMIITEACYEDSIDKHKDKIGYSVRCALPGDRSRDVSWKVTETTDCNSMLYKVPEYETSITYNGKKYVKRTLPFGDMHITGDKIKNEISLNSITRKMKSELQEKNTERKNAIEKNISNATGSISFLTIALLAASIVVSLLIRSRILVVGLFAVSVVSFILNNIIVKSATKSEEKCAEDEIAQATAKVNDEIANYSTNYKLRQREALDNKLKSLGYEPTTAEEL